MSLLTIFLAAVSFWGQGNLPACGQPKLAVAQLDGVDGRANFQTCTANITYRVADLYQNGSPVYRCAVVFHEVGHLYGLQHSERGVMSTPIKSAPPICWRMINWRGTMRTIARTTKEQR